MLCLHTRLPFSKSFTWTIQFRYARKGLFHKVPIKAALHAKKIRCYNINHKFEKGVKLSMKYNPSFNVSPQLNFLSSFCLALNMQPRYGKEFSLHGLRIGGLIIIRIQDVSPTPHNGCQPPISLRRPLLIWATSKGLQKL
jgi:hypothetical protein